MSESTTEDVRISPTGEEEESTRGDEPVEPRKAGPFGGLSPSEARARRAEKDRARAAEREAQADYDRLSVSSRTATALAAEATYAQLRSILHALMDKAADGSVQAAREVRNWLALAGIDAGPSDGEAQDWAEMSAEQRAAARAQIEAELASLLPAEGNVPA